MGLCADVAAIHGDLVSLRHALHQEPEVGLDLPRTQAKVLAALKDLPLEIIMGDGLTSVVAVLRGAQPGPSVLLRADMDALPLAEKTGLPYQSRIAGAMHACGHDMHTTMLVGAARVLAAMRENLHGTVVFMFQPGEEGFDGAGCMLKEGVLTASGERPVAAYALHVAASVWDPGTFALRPGPFLAASDALQVTVLGAGGHGSTPHLAKDPIPAACEMVTAMQSLVSRVIDPVDPVVVTVGSIHAGTKRSIIPDTASFEATARSFSPGAREALRAGLIRLCRGIADAHGLHADIHYTEEYPVTVNDDDESSFAADIIRAVYGPDRFRRAEKPLTWAEDFSRVLAEVPGAMVVLGAAPQGTDITKAPGNHSPYAIFDDEQLTVGAALYAELASRRLNRSHGGGE